MRGNLFLIFIVYTILAFIVLFLYKWLVCEVLCMPVLFARPTLNLIYFFVYLLFAILFPDWNIFFATFTAVLWQLIGFYACQLGVSPDFCVEPETRAIAILASVLGFAVGTAAKYLPRIQNYVTG